ncbi:hypothetical protein PAXRUDRAFT_826903 [Paxillus rubicundulus Ve08.2h10]|uniref:Uncharacterized protein n=1 Tax=Paxillus rubicundulus Ve08.2h10 TaxID=930991 RepID=A0A0D0E992_9AGAM|nr:hypothetical protein PAXRUDRAFT_826903 [Paxillus rubicundulus Ve08.2h10]
MSAASHIPLIKSPALRVPPPVGLPPDIHPLPDSVTPYFVYPFTLEPHVLAVESSRRERLSNYVARREALLRSREDEKERRRREALKKVAPGFNGDGTMLTPDSDRRSSVDVMDDLVDQLARIDHA